MNYGKFQLTGNSEKQKNFDIRIRFCLLERIEKISVDLHWILSFVTFFARIEISFLKFRIFGLKNIVHKLNSIEATIPGLFSIDLYFLYCIRMVQLL